MSIRPIDNVGVVNKVQQVSEKRQMEKSKEQMLNHNTFLDIQKKEIKKQEKVNNVEKSVYNKITRDNREKREGNKEKNDKEEKDNKGRKGKNIDIRI